jgi:Domain of unknown function (DUF4476)
MKYLILFFLSFLLVLPAGAQQDLSTVTITVNGNTGLQLRVDEKEYTSNNNSPTSSITIIEINNLATSQHNLQITRSVSYSRRQDKIFSMFYLRQGYDMLIELNEDGSLELVESKKQGTGYNYDPPMSNALFTNLLNNVKRQPSTIRRRTQITNAFNDENNNFTTSQAEQLIRLVNSENYRLQLAKLSYKTITDPDDFNHLYDVLNSQTSRDELAEYIRNFDNNNTILKNPMTDAGFTTLYQNIRNQRLASTQINLLTETFNNTTYYFTTAQTSQLIQLANTEANRLQLAKLSYRSITDPANFNQVSSLLNYQSSRDELADYVSNYKNNKSPAIAMSASDFNNLLQSVKNQWPANMQLSSLTAAFNNTNNYFTSYQASQLIQLANTETTRLQLAKLSYRSITDPANFSQVSSLLNYQSSRDELASYVTNYGNLNIKTAMTDGEFGVIYQSVQQRIFPGEKMSALVNAFNTPSNYFRTAQAKQLIELVSLESNRLQLAKLSYRTITDRNLFNQLYNVLNSQASRDELDTYVKTYND